jgi:HEAT repeat protein
MSATLEQVVTVRSQLALAIEEYYRKLIEKADRTPWFRAGERISASAVAIPARVLKEAMRPRREPGARGERDVEGENLRRRAGVDPNIASLSEEAIGEKRREESPWGQERLLLQRAVVLGAPGGGKTFLAQTTALELARHGIQELESRSKPLDQLPLPIWVELNDLAREAKPDDLLDLLVALVSKRSAAPALENWLRRHLPRSNCWLILDALDQVEPAHRVRLKQRLESIETRSWQCRALLTCRKVNYDRSAIPWGTVTEYNLAPFQPAEIEDFITRWHGEQNARGEKLNAIVWRSYSLHHACRTPLVTTLACLANQEKELTEETRRGDLYGQVLRGLLQKAWRTDPHSSQDAHIDDLLEMLRPLAWELFVASPSVNQFPNSQVKTAISRGARIAGLATPITDLRDELVDCGVLVGAGLKNNEAQLSFLHRAFQEFLVAEHLSRAANEQGWERSLVAGESGRRIPLRILLDKKSWLAEWQEVMTLVAGSLNDPGPLLKLLSVAGTDDLFRHRLALAAECLGELSGQPGCIAPINDLTAQAWACYWKHAKNGTIGAVEPIALALPAMATVDGEIKPQVRLLAYVVGLLRDTGESAHVRSQAAYVLEQMGPAAARPDVVDRLVESLRDTEWEVQDNAACALERMGPAAARADVVDRLVEWLLDPEEKVPQFRAARVLGRMGLAAARPDVVDRLVECLRDPEKKVRSHAAEALGELGPAAARPDVVDRLLSWLRDPEWNVRFSAAEALGELGPAAARPDVVDRLVNWLRDPEREVQHRAMDALTKMGPAAVSPDVVEWLRDPDSSVRSIAEDVVRRMGPAAARPGVVDRLLESLRDTEWNVRLNAMFVLAEMGPAAARPDVVDRLVDWLRDPDSSVRFSVAEALGRMGPAAARADVVDRLAKWLRDPHSSVRYSAAQTLGELGPAAARADVVDRLVEWLLDPKRKVQHEAMTALAAIGPAAARVDVVDRLVELLADPAQSGKFLDTRTYALERMMGPAVARTDVVDRLVERLQDPELHVRMGAAEALCRMMNLGARFFRATEGLTVAWVRDLSR